MLVGHVQMHLKYCSFKLVCVHLINMRKEYTHKMCAFYLILLYMCKKLQLQKEVLSDLFFCIFISYGIAKGFHILTSIALLYLQTEALHIQKIGMRLWISRSKPHMIEARKYLPCIFEKLIKCPQLLCVRPKLFDAAQKTCGSAHQRCSISLLFHVQTRLDFRSPLKLNSNY